MGERGSKGGKVLDESVFMNESTLRTTVTQSCWGNAETPSRTHPSEFSHQGQGSWGINPSPFPSHWARAAPAVCLLSRTFCLPWE